MKKQIDKKVKVSQFKDKDILFDEYSNKFTCNYNGEEFSSDSIIDLKRNLERETIQEFTGEFYVKEYDGIDKFIAKRKYFDAYSGVNYINGVRIDGEYQSQTKDDRLEESELYPMTPENTKVFEECNKTKSDGWSLREKGVRMRNLLKK